MAYQPEFVEIEGQRYIFMRGDTFKKGRRPLRIGEGPALGAGGAFFSDPGEEFGGNPSICCLELEDGSDTIGTEDGAGCIQMEACPS